MAGENGLFRYGFEASAGFMGPVDEMTYARFISETLKMDRPYEPDPNLDPSGNETQGENLKAEGAGSVIASPDSESWLKMRIHQHGWAEQSSPAAGVELYTLRDEGAEDYDTPLVQYVDSLHASVWRDEETLPSLYEIMGAKVNLFTASVDANKHLRFQHDLLFTRDRYMAAPVEQAVNAAWTGDIFADGHRLAGDENGDYFKFKVPAGGGGAVGVAKFVFGKGAAAYGATEYLTATVMELMNADDSRAGTRLNPIRLLLIPGGVLTAGDEWRIYPWSVKPEPVYSERPKLNGSAMDLEIVVGGATLSRVVEKYSMKMGHPREAKFGLGSNYAQRIGRPTNSKKWWEIEMDTPYLDRVIVQAMISGANVTAHAKFYGALIGATGLEDFAEFTFSHLRVTDGGATVSTPGELPEKVTLRAFSVNNSTLCTERYQNTVDLAEVT